MHTWRVVMRKKIIGVLLGLVCAASPAYAGDGALDTLHGWEEIQTATKRIYGGRGRTTLVFLAAARLVAAEGRDQLEAEIRAAHDSGHWPREWDRDLITPELAQYLCKQGHDSRYSQSRIAVANLWLFILESNVDEIVSALYAEGRFSDAEDFLSHGYVELHTQIAPYGREMAVWRGVLDEIFTHYPCPK